MPAQPNTTHTNPEPRLKTRMQPQPSPQLAREQNDRKRRESRPQHHPSQRELRQTTHNAQAVFTRETIPQNQVCFGHETALRIARSINVDELTAKTGSRHLLSPQPPKRNDLRAALTFLDRACPTLQLDKPVHFLVGSTSRCRYSDDYEPHVCMTTLAGKAFYQLADNILFSTPTLAFIQIAAREKDPVSFLKLGYELCGSYRTKRTSASPAYQVDPLTCTSELRSCIARNPSLRGSQKVKRALRYLADGSASPRETQQALVYGLPMMYGGYGLGIPCMNYEVQASAAAYAISGKRSFRCDLCWPQAKVDVEYQSRENHEGEESRIKDSRRTNALASMGWTVIGVTNDELDSLAATDTITQTIRHLLGLRSQVRVSDYHARKLRLRRKLGLPTRYI